MSTCQGDFDRCNLKDNISISDVILSCCQSLQEAQGNSPDVLHEQKIFQSQSMIEAIKNTCDKNSKHSHQRRLCHQAMDKAKEGLLECAQQLSDCRGNFEDFYGIVCDQILDIDGIGRLAVYDFSLRLGKFRGIHPDEYIYLHTAPMEAARAIAKLYPLKLGFRIKKEDFTRVFPRLSQCSADDIESCLCICKKCIIEIVRRQK